MPGANQNTELLAIMHNLLAELRDLRTSRDKQEAADKVVERLEAKLDEIDRVVRTGDGSYPSLVTQLAEVKIELRQISADQLDMNKDVRKAFDRIKVLDEHETKSSGSQRIAAIIVAILGWLVTTGISAYAAITSNNK